MDSLLHSPENHESSSHLQEKYVQILNNSGTRLVTMHPTTHAKPRTQNCAHSFCVEKDRLHEYTKQCIEPYVNIYMFIYLFQIIIYIKVVTETEEVGWVMEGTVYAQD